MYDMADCISMVFLSIKLLIDIMIEIEVASFKFWLLVCAPLELSYVSIFFLLVGGCIGFY